MKPQARFRQNLLDTYRFYQQVFLWVLVPICVLTSWFIYQGFSGLMKRAGQTYVFHRDGGSIQVYLPNVQPVIRTSVSRTSSTTPPAPRH